MKHLILTLMALILTPFAALAFRLEPMVADFEATGPNQSRVFKVENNGQDRIAIQIKVTTRQMDSKGVESREVSSDFSVYPEQISLGPNDVRNIRVTYKGEPKLNSEKSYRLIASQLPVDFQAKKNETQLNFLFEYVASVYVRPENAAAKLEVTQVQALGGRKIHLVLQNSGTSHRLLRGVMVAISNETGKSIPLSESSFKNWPSENILAGNQREFELESKETVASPNHLKASLQIQDHP